MSGSKSFQVILSPTVQLQQRASVVSLSDEVRMFKIILRKTQIEAFIKTLRLRSAQQESGGIFSPEVERWVEDDGGGETWACCCFICHSDIQMLS